MGITTVGLIGTIVALLVGFMLGVVASQFGIMAGSVSGAPRINFRQLRSGIAVFLALGLAVYLIIISIVATQIFDQKLADPNEPIDRLQKNLSAMSANVPESLQEASSPIADNLGDIAPVLDLIRGVNPQLAEYIKSVSAQFKEYRSVIEAQPKVFAPRTKEETSVLEREFDRQNHDHPGVRQTEAHVDKLTQFFGIWISTWTSTTQNCRGAISLGQTGFASFIEKVEIAIKNDPQGNGDFPPWPDRAMEFDPNSRM